MRPWATDKSGREPLFTRTRRHARTLPENRETSRRPRRTGSRGPALGPLDQGQLPLLPPDGLVIAGFGGGHAHTTILGLIDELIAGGVCVVAASRCGAGDTLRSTYGVPGTEIDLRERGVLMAGALSPPKARLRLQVALANGVAPPSVFPLED